MSLPVERRVFHCILDDTALTTNISEIKKWALSGAITLFVPLYTIERLRAIKFSKPNSQIASNAGQALNFLDRATSGKYDIPESRVALQGPLEQFVVWEDAQKFFLPEFEEEVIPEKQTAGGKEGEGEEERGKDEDAKKADKNGEPLQLAQLNEMSQMLLSKLNIQKISETEPVVDNDTSNDTTASDVSCGSRSNGAPAHNDADEESTSTPTFAAPPVPEYLKPLLSCVLWQLHEAPPSNVAPSSQSQPRKLITPLKSWVLITNDWTVRNWAAKYGIQVKTIHQLRTAISYEDKEYKNHVKYMERNQAQQQQQQQIQAEQNATQTVPATHLPNGNTSKPSYDEETDTSEDELVFVPRGPKFGAASVAATSKPSTSLATPRSQSRRKSNSRAANGSAATPGLSSTAISITDSPTLLEAKSSPIVEIPSSPIDPDSFSRNIVVTRSPMSQAQGQGQGQGQSHVRGHGNGHGHAHGHGSYGRGGVPPRGPKTSEPPSAPAHGVRGSANGRGGVIPSGPRRRGGGGSGGRGGNGNGIARGFGGIQRGRGRLWVP